MLPPALDPKVLEPIEVNAAISPASSATPGGSAPAAVEASPAPALDEAVIKTELSTATDFAGLSPDLQALFRQYFDRYDLNSNGSIDSNKELTQLVTNLTFTLKTGIDIN